MKVAKGAFIGPSIAYEAKNIIISLERNKSFKKRMWYVVTTAKGEELLYILSSLELRHDFYRTSDLTVLGIAGSRKEAYEIVRNIFQDGVDRDHLFHMKEFLKTY